MAMKLEDLKIRYPELLPDNACSSFMPAGWLPLFAQLCRDIDDTAARLGIKRSDKAYPKIVQYKEKFSEMRVYVNCEHNNELFKAVLKLTGMAGTESEKICSKCGAPAVWRNEAYVRNYCDPCEADFQRKLKAREQ